MADSDAGLWAVSKLGGGAHLIADGVRNIRMTFLVDRQNFLEQRAAFLTRGLRESVKRATGRRNSAVDILRAPQGDDPRGLLGSRIDDRKFPGLNRSDPAPVYIEVPVFVGHQWLLQSRVLRRGSVPRASPDYSPSGSFRSIGGYAAAAATRPFRRCRGCASPG